MSRLFLRGLASTAGIAIAGGNVSPAPSFAKRRNGHVRAAKVCLASEYPARVCRRMRARMKGTQTQTMVTGNRQSCAGMVNSVMPKTDCEKS